MSGNLDDRPNARRPGAVMICRELGEFGSRGGRAGSGALPADSKRARSDRSTVWEFVGLLALYGVIAAEMIRACS
jgi:hypothetical protein